MTMLVSKPKIINVVLTAAGTEYTAVIPAGTSRFKVQARGSNLIQLSYMQGESNTNFWTIKVAPADPYEERGLVTKERTLYVQSPDAGTVAEIVLWN